MASGKIFHVYILTNKPYGVLYTGVTSSLAQRVQQHKEGIVDGFSQKYKIKTLVYYEAHENPESAITREKQIKKWRRQWKIELIEKGNPQWFDLHGDILKKVNG